MIGPGKYDDICTEIREKTAAEGAIVIVLGGSKGSGFSVQVDGHMLAFLPDLLEDLAKQIRADMMPPFPADPVSEAG
jgi:hypothetical protein